MYIRSVPDSEQRNQTQTQRDEAERRRADEAGAGSPVAPVLDAVPTRAWDMDGHQWCKVVEANGGEPSDCRHDTAYAFQTLSLPQTRGCRLPFASAHGS